jgi:UDP-3-O-[3-hydroxymyristoyl] N-acetylglucosamine deacetylase / 3-hydroxyacyl-[acyl-carrier-protein] dehydratase
MIITYQQTIKEPVEISGMGWHTGVLVTMRLVPADVNTGFIFKRTDLPGEPTLPADAYFATDTERGTTLEFGKAKVSTIEHALAAFTGLGITNLLIELNAQEAPIMDGSSMPFIDAILTVGILRQKALVEFYSINKSITYKDEEKNVEMIALPYDGFKVTCMIDFNSNVLGQQHATMNTIGDFAKEIASARTFCFFRELKYLATHNLIKGGDLNNAVVVVDQLVTEDELDELAKLLNKTKISVQKEGVLNNSPMRFANEPARHKLLDVVGDLALVGRPIKAHIIASRPGHKTNVEFAKLLKQQMTQ